VLLYAVDGPTVTLEITGSVFEISMDELPVPDPPWGSLTVAEQVTVSPGETTEADKVIEAPDPKITFPFRHTYPTLVESSSMSETDAPQLRVVEV